MASWYLKSPRSLSITSGSYCSSFDNTAIADFPPSIRSVYPNDCFGAIRPFFTEILQILYLTLKIQGQGHGQEQTWWSHSKPRVQSICLLFVSWQSEHFGLRYSKLFIWPLKSKVKVMVELDQNLIRYSVGEVHQSWQKWTKSNKFFKVVGMNKSLQCTNRYNGIKSSWETHFFVVSLCHEIG